MLSEVLHSRHCSFVDRLVDKLILPIKDNKIGPLPIPLIDFSILR